MTKTKRFEFNCFIIEAEVETEHFPAEPRTRDYPGYPEYWEFYGVTVTRVIGEFYDIRRNERPDWFEWLDEVASAAIDSDKEWFLK